MTIAHQQSLRHLNTFHIDETAKELMVIANEQELSAALHYAHENSRTIKIIGGGSNILLTHSPEALILLNRMKGIQVKSETDQFVDICFQSGEIWHDCVMYCVERNLGGIENLSLIPGSIGAAPIQNIGAYGAELKDVFVELEALDLNNGHKKIFQQETCAFGYRDSLFKHPANGHYFILSVTLRLQKNPVFNIDYGDIKTVIATEYEHVVNLKNISAAVIQIRRSKLPDPELIGNAGSFFKNPVIPEKQARQLQQTHPSLPVYPVENGIKIPAAWLIEQCGWKGFRENDYGVHERQALVLVNYQHARGADILHLSERIITSVQQQFNIHLEREVNIW